MHYIAPAILFSHENMSLVCFWI